LGAPRLSVRIGEKQTSHRAQGKRGHHQPRAALEAAGGARKKTAELLHIKSTTLDEMIKRYEIRPRRRKGAGEAEATEDLAAETVSEDE
jgi:DNA-binding NtrC family response regulator